MSYDFNKITEVRLSGGAHPSPESGLCFMEMVAWFAGEDHTDRPRCACPVLGQFGIAMNDGFDEATRDRLLKPLVPLIAGTRGSHHDELARARFLAMWTVNRVMPVWLRAYGFRRLDELALECERARSIDDLNRLAARAALADLADLAALTAQAARADLAALTAQAARADLAAQAARADLAAQADLAALTAQAALADLAARADLADLADLAARADLAALADLAARADLAAQAARADLAAQADLADLAARADLADLAARAARARNQVAELMVEGLRQAILIGPHEGFDAAIDIAKRHTELRELVEA